MHAQRRDAHTRLAHHPRAHHPYAPAPATPQTLVYVLDVSAGASNVFREMPVTQMAGGCDVLGVSNASIVLDVILTLNSDTAPAAASPLVVAYLPLPQATPTSKMATMTKALASGMRT